MPADETINFTKEAFMAPVNLVFLIAALFLSTVVLSGGVASLALLFAAAAELLYLGTMPRNERFRRVIRSRKAAEHKSTRSDGRETFRTLDRDSQKRSVRFRNMERAIKENYGKLPYSSQGLLDAHLRKLDGLLDAHLNLLYLRERYLRFSARTGEANLDQAIQDLRTEMESDPPRVRAIKQRRLTILEKRLDRFKQAGENLAVIEAQLATIEDVTRYVYEQSLTMQNPEEVSFQLDTLVSEVEETQASMEALDDVLGDPAMGISDADLEAFDASPAGRLSSSALDELDDLTRDEPTRAPRQREG